MSKPTIAEIEAQIECDPGSVTLEPDGYIVWSPWFGVRLQESVVTLLRNLTVERQGWRRYVFGRWLIADEPLRTDAARLLRNIEDERKEPTA